jgi:L-asparaginase II
MSGTSATEGYVEVVRHGVVESRHRVHAAVVDSGERLRASLGDPDRVTFLRSAAKPFQALPVVADGAMDRFGIALEELAICCGSHSGEPRHLEVAGSLLRRLGLDGESLACGPHDPVHEPSRRALAEAGLEPMRLHNNCSGKHAGMLALARVHGWECDGYHRPEHPVQQRVLSEIARWVGVPVEAMALGTDGCGVVSPALPLRHVALGYARLASAARCGDHDPTYVVGAMTSYPDMVAGEQRLCSDLMRRTAGRVFAKVGAEGVYAVGVPGAELGITVKIEDGAARALAPAVLSLLRQLDLISEDDFGALYQHAFPELLNTRGEVVGEIRAAFTLRTPGD